MIHYYANPLSFLTNVNPQNFEEEVYHKKLLDDSNLLNIRMMKSFQKYIETISSEDPDLARELIESDSTLTEYLPVFMQELHLHHIKFSTGILILKTIQTYMNVPTLQMPIRTLLKEGLNSEMAKTDHVITVLKLIRFYTSLYLK